MRTADKWITVIMGAFIIFLVGWVIYANKTGSAEGIIPDIILPIATVLMMLLTFNVSSQSLSFTKRQSTFNALLDNFKMYNDLAKRPLGILSHTEEVGTTIINQIPFKNLTIDNMNIHFREMIRYYSRLKFTASLTVSDKPRLAPYNVVFERFYMKLQAFLDVVSYELKSIKKNENITYEQKVSLFNLYSSFVLADYLKLAEDISRHRKLLQAGNYESQGLLYCIEGEDESIKLSFNPLRYLEVSKEIEIDSIPHD